MKSGLRRHLLTGDGTAKPADFDPQFLLAYELAKRNVPRLEDTLEALNQRRANQLICHRLRFHRCVATQPVSTTTARQRIKVAESRHVLLLPELCLSFLNESPPSNFSFIYSIDFNLLLLAALPSLCVPYMFQVCQAAVKRRPCQLQ